jgi:hypothetical protein
MPRSLKTLQKIKGLKEVIRVISVIRVLLLKKMRGWEFITTTHPLNKKGEEFSSTLIALIAQMVAPQTHTQHRNPTAIGA